MQKSNLENIRKLKEYLKQNNSYKIVDSDISVNSSAIKALFDLQSSNLRAKEYRTYNIEKGKDLNYKLLVEKVAKELYQNLLFTKSQNITIKQIKDELNEIFDKKITFKYQALTNKISVYEESEQGILELHNEEKDIILNKLWQITLIKVSDTMQTLVLDKENGMNIKKSSSSTGSFSSSSIGQGKSSKAYAASASSQVNSVSATQVASSVEGVNASGDTINVSPEGILRTEAYRSAMSASDIRQEKIDAIKNKISSGTYTIDTKKLAFNLLKDETILFS